MATWHPHSGYAFLCVDGIGNRTVDIVVVATAVLTAAAVADL